MNYSYCKKKRLYLYDTRVGYLNLYTNKIKGL